MLLINGIVNRLARSSYVRLRASLFLRLALRKCETQETENDISEEIHDDVEKRVAHFWTVPWTYSKLCGVTLWILPQVCAAFLFSQEAEKDLSEEIHDDVEKRVAHFWTVSWIDSKLCVVTLWILSQVCAALLFINLVRDFYITLHFNAACKNFILLYESCSWRWRRPWLIKALVNTVRSSRLLQLMFLWIRPTFGRPPKHFQQNATIWRFWQKYDSFTNNLHTF